MIKGFYAYQFSNSQLKYLPKDSVVTLLKSFLYSNKPVFLDANVDRRPSNDNDAGKRTDPNLSYRIGELKDWIF